MTTYKELFGKYVQNLSSDPTSTDAEGQIWYNSTSGTFKTALGSQGAWASGGNLNTSRSLVGAGIGLQNAALAAGGFSSPVGNYVGSTELYNGTSWTSNPTGMNTARGNGFNCGTQSAAVYGSGYFTSIVNTTELWNGTSWTSNPTGMNTARIYGGRAASATQTAALAFGGEGTPRAATGATESFNGTSWTSLNSLNTARSSGVSGAGTLTAALAFGGFPSTTATESFNGTSWTTVNSLNTGRQYLTGFGLQTAAVAAGGYNPLTSPNYVGTTEQWNGTSWTSNPVGLTTVRSGGGGAGTQTSGLVFGGETGPSTLTSTEVWSRSAVVPVAGSWSSGGNMSLGRNSGGSSGTQTAALYFGGFAATGKTGSTELYNGTAWTTSPASLNVPGQASNAGVGTQTATITASRGVNPDSPAYSATSESWNGTSWTNTPNANTARADASMSGTQTAALLFSGYTPSVTGATESWNGSSWTTLPATMNTARAAGGGTGTQTAALIFGGTTNGSDYLTATESWNGSSWTTINSLNTARLATGRFGTQTLAVAAGGYGPPGNVGLSATEVWNGTSWTNSTNMSTARGGLGGAGTQANGLAFNGFTGTARTTSTEAFTGPYTTLNYKTLTTS